MLKEGFAARGQYVVSKTSARRFLLLSAQAALERAPVPRALGGVYTGIAPAAKAKEKRKAQAVSIGAFLHPSDTEICVSASLPVLGPVHKTFRKQAFSLRNLNPVHRISESFCEEVELWLL